MNIASEFLAELFQILNDDTVESAALNMSTNWKTQQQPQEWKRSVFISIPKKSNAKGCSNYHAVVLISHASKVILKILQARVSSKGTENFQMYKLDLENAEETEIKLPTSVGSQEKHRSAKKIYFCFIDYAKAFDCIDHNQLWKTLKEMRIPDHLTCLLRNLYAGQEAQQLPLVLRPSWVTWRCVSTLKTQRTNG